MEPPRMEPKFKVIVVGGSIAGLTMAHCLERAGIEYVVLERRCDIAPQVGASVGIMPNGARVLDQLGLFDVIEVEIEPLVRSHICYPDGFSFISAFPTLVNERFAYPIAFLERRKLLDILYNGLKDKTKVHPEKEVIKVEQSNTVVRVFTRDGCCYDGDLVVGADGVHSRVRSEMWQIADVIRPGLITTQEKNSMTAEYSCVFGISSAVPGLMIGEQVTCFYNGLTILTFHGKGGRIFWFVIKKMDKSYVYPDVPRFTGLDAERLCQDLQSTKIRGGISFGHIWACREVCSMTALEENVFQHWHFGRIVCFGDSMHKMTPNLGQGANCAIESAAALANKLHDMINIHNIPHPSNGEIDSRLNAFIKSRRARTASISKTAAFVTRLQARDGLVNRIIGTYFAPYAGDLPADMCSKVIVGAMKLDYIPVTERSEKGSRTFHLRQRCRGSNLIRRMLLVSVLFVMAAVAIRVLNPVWGSLIVFNLGL